MEYYLVQTAIIEQHGFHSSTVCFWYPVLLTQRAPVWHSNFIHSLINRRFLFCAFFCLSSSSSDKGRQGLHGKASANVKLLQFLVCLGWRTVPVEITENLGSSPRRNAEALQACTETTAPSCQHSGARLAWLPSVVVCCSSSLCPQGLSQWRGQEEKMSGRSEPWWGDGDSLGAARSFYAYLHGSWRLIANPAGVSPADSCCFLTNAHNFLLIYAILHLLCTYPHAKMS